MFHKNAVIKGKFYKVGIGSVHLKHAGRIKYDTNHIPNPNVKFVVARDGIVSATDWSEVYKAYKFSVENRRRKDGNVYYELMVSGYKEEDTIKILLYMHDRFEGRHIYALEHRDEGEFHTHFIIHLKDDEHKDKALRLQISDLIKLKHEVAEITQQVFDGVRYIDPIKFKGNFEFFKGRLQEAKEKAAEREEMVKKRVNEIAPILGRLLEAYKAIKVRVVKFDTKNRQGEMGAGYEYVSWTEKGNKLNVFHNLEELNLNRLIRKDKDGENFFFSPVLEDEKVHALFLDDVPEEKLEELPKKTLIIETSSHKYQVHIPLEEPISKGEAAVIQKKLTKYYNSDIASSDILHLRRLPGFRNFKPGYTPNYPEVRFVMENENGRIFNEILKDLTNIEVVKKTEEKKKGLQDKIATVQLKLQPDLIEREEKWRKQWQEYYISSGYDESRADIMLVIYLISREGARPETAIHILKLVSKDLEERKKGHIMDYLKRTIDNAISWIEYKAQNEEAKVQEVFKQEGEIAMQIKKQI